MLETELSFKRAFSESRKLDGPVWKFRQVRTEIFTDRRFATIPPFTDCVENEFVDGP